MNPAPNQQQVQVKASDEILRGVYANQVQAQFTKEEFVVDCMNTFPPVATLNARLILSPAHAKRMAVMLANLVKQYETQHGAIAATEQPNEIGFRA